MNYEDFTAYQTSLLVADGEILYCNIGHGAYERFVSGYAETHAFST